MASTCPVGFDVDKLRELIRAEYDRVAREPDGSFHFHRGPEYACRMLGYSPEELAAIPAESTAAFAGVGNPHRIGPINPGETVLDIGCGAGMDLMLAARRTGPSGKAIGVDMTPSMLELAKRGTLKAGLWENVEVRRGTAEELPVESESVDVVISNGVLNSRRTKIAHFERSTECCARKAACISPMSWFRESFHWGHEAMSTSGQPELAVLCRRRSFIRSPLELVSLTASLSSGLTVMKEHPPKPNCQKTFSWRGRIFSREKILARAKPAFSAGWIDYDNRCSDLPTQKPPPLRLRS